MNQAAFALHAEVKDRFFDRAAVIAAIEKTEHAALYRMGRYVRRRAMTDVLRRAGKRKTSTPGNPPLVHSRDTFTNLRNILYALGPDNQSVVIGPRAVPSLRLKKSTARTVPQLLEFGGTSTVPITHFPSGEIVLGNAAGEIPGAEVEYVEATYKPRPFMSVALEREALAGSLVDAFSYGVNR